MNLELNREAEEMAFRPVGPEGKAARSVHRGRHHHIVVQLGTGDSMTPQQRIGQLESQNQLLLQEVQIWKNASLSFARDLRAARLGSSFLTAAAGTAPAHDPTQRPA